MKTSSDWIFLSYLVSDKISAYRNGDRIATEKADDYKLREEKKRLKAETHRERLRRKEIRDQELGYKKKRIT